MRLVFIVLMMLLVACVAMNKPHFVSRRMRSHSIVTGLVRSHRKVHVNNKLVVESMADTHNLPSKDKSILGIRGGVSIGPLTPTIGFYLYCATVVFYFIEVLVRPGPMLMSFTDFEFNKLTIFLDVLLHSAMLVMTGIIFYFRNIIGIQNAVRSSLAWAVVDFIGQVYGRFGIKIIKSNEGVIGTFAFMVLLFILGL